MSKGSEPVHASVTVESVAEVVFRSAVVVVRVEAIHPAPTPLITLPVQTDVRSRLFARPPPHRRVISKPCSVRRARLRAVLGEI